MRESKLSRRGAGLLFVLLLAATGLACGRNRVVLDVDARSFLRDADMVHTYNAVGLLPFTIRLDSIPVNLVEGFTNFGEAESATIDLAIDYDNTLGTGSGRFRLYFSDSTSTLFSTPPVAILEANLTPGAVATATAHVPADQRVLDLLSGKQFWMGGDLEWLSATMEPLQGTASIRQIDLHLVSTLALFQ